MKDKDTYFNFPICLIDGIFEDKMNVLDNIFNYAVYAHAVKLEQGNINDKIKAALKYFGVTANIKHILNEGSNLLLETPAGSPKASIKKDLYFDFYKNEKTEFELAVLCGFCAIRSILLFKPYCKLTDNYMLARMASKATVKEIKELPEPLIKYTNRYHLDKIKKELRNNWNLKLYGYKTRGFYVSFELTLIDLISVAEKKREKYIDKNYQSVEAEARKSVLQKLYGPPVAISDFIIHTKVLVKEKPDGDYGLEKTSKETVDAMKFIIKNKLIPEMELSISPDFKNLTIKHLNSNDNNKRTS